MSTESADTLKLRERILIGLIFYGFLLTLLLGVSVIEPFLDGDKPFTDNRDKLVVLIIASMTAAATLLTTTPEDNPVKQLSFLLIAMAGVVAAVVAIPPQSWWLFVFLIGGLAPAVLAFAFVFWCLFEGSRWAYLLLVKGTVLVWAAAFLMQSNLGASLSKEIGDSVFLAVVIALTAIGFISALVGWRCNQSNER